MVSTKEIGDVVEHMLGYIENNLQKKITLNDLAKAIGYSQWHTSRIFTEYTGMNPFQYIRKMRLEKAALMLRNEKCKIVDVAFDFVFDSHEGFTRAFTRQFGRTPKNFRKDCKKPLEFMSLSARNSFLRLKNGGLSMTDKKSSRSFFVQVVDRPARKLILKRGKKATDYFEYCEEVGCDVWEVLTGVKEALYEPAGMWLPERLRKPGTSEYVQGVEVPDEYNGDIPEGFEIIELRPCKIMVFQGEPFDEEKFGEAIHELWEIIEKYDPKVYGFEWADEDGPSFQLEPRGFRGYIEARPVREI